MTSAFMVNGDIYGITPLMIRKACREQCEELGPTNQPVALTVKVFTKEKAGRTWDYYAAPHQIAEKVANALEGTAYWSAKKVMRLRIEKYYSKRVHDHLYVEITKLRGVS